MNVGENITVIERTYDRNIFEWDAIITKLSDGCIETQHRRERRPEWDKYNRAYEITTTKHYGLQNLK